MKFKTVTKEELELMPFDDIAYVILKEKGKKMKINEIFKIICDTLELGDAAFENQIADFFTLLATEKRFIQLEKGYWDLRENHTAEIRIKDIEEELNEEEIMEEDYEQEEDEEYSETKDIDDDDTDDDLKDLVNISIRRCLYRTILTTITTLLPVVVLMIFGAEEIINFNIALFVGFIAGVYSSIFISNQIWYYLEKRKIERPKKIDDDDEISELKVKGINC